MRMYVAFDDTDTLDSDFGTGKLTRWFEDELPEDCRLWGVVRQQLPQLEAIPFTSHNSSACAIVEAPDNSMVTELISRAIAHVERHSVPGSDPGVCVACENDPALDDLIEFGLLCSREVVTQKAAMQASAGIHLSGHGGTNDGIIGAAAAVSLCVYGRSGRLIEYGNLRKIPTMVSMADLEEQYGIQVLSVDRNAVSPTPDDPIDTRGWLRPRLWEGKAVLPVQRVDGGDTWETMARKHKKEA